MFLYSYQDTGLEDAKALVYHPLTKHIHLTGGGPTHDGIIAGAPDGKLAAKFTSELGCVTPWVVVPTHNDGTTKAPDGKEGWSAKSIKSHAKNLVAAGKINGSASCNAHKVLVVAKEWEFKDAFIDEFKRALAEQKCNPAYYPGYQQRFDRFVAEYGEGVEIITSPPVTGKGEGVKHAVLNIQLGPGNSGGNRYALKNEAFAPVFAVVELECNEPEGTKDNLPERFLKTFPKFVNDELFGSLSCTLLTPPAVPVEPLEQAIAELKYGNVSLNGWSAAVGYGCPNATWGAYPGLYGGLGKSDSGYGVVMNRLLFDESKILKSVTRAPFHSAVFQLNGDLPPAIIIELLYEATRQRSLNQQVWAVTKHLSYRAATALLCGLF
jgi:hypothetical protein